MPKLEDAIPVRLTEGCTEAIAKLAKHHGWKMSVALRKIIEASPLLEEGYELAGSEPPKMPPKPSRRKPELYTPYPVRLPGVNIVLEPMDPLWQLNRFGGLKPGDPGYEDWKAETLKSAEYAEVVEQEKRKEKLRKLRDMRLAANKAVFDEDMKLDLKTRRRRRQERWEECRERIERENREGIEHLLISGAIE